MLFIFPCSGAPRYLHSFPTRRSSDLHPLRREGAGGPPPPASVAARATHPSDVLLERHVLRPDRRPRRPQRRVHPPGLRQLARPRSEEHTSELQSQSNLVCRLLLEKKK